MKPKLTKSMLLLAAGSLLLSFVACSDTGTTGPSDLPQFENSAPALQRTFDTVTADANAKLAALAALDTAHLTFENSILAFEEIIDSVTLAANRASVLKDVSPTPEIAGKARGLGDAYTGWFNATFNNGSVYKMLKAYADTNPALPPDGKKLLNDTVKVFKDNGISDDGVAIPAVLALQNEVSALQIQIDAAVTAAAAETVSFTAAELEGLGAADLAGFDRDGERYLVQKGDRGTLQDVIMTFAVKEATRKKAKLASNSQAQSDITLITDLVRKRVELARTL